MPASDSFVYKLFGLGFEEHGGYDAPIDKSGKAGLGVVGLGLPRTGTTSLARALETLGVGPVFQPIDIVRQPALREAWIDTYQHVLDGRWSAGDPALNSRLQGLFAGYGSCMDNPPPYIARAMYCAFPNAKFILSLRRTPGPDTDSVSASAHTWWESIWNAARTTMSKGWDRTIYKLLTYPVTWMRRVDDMVQLGFNIQRREMGERLNVEMGAVGYDKHYELVKKTIPPDQLLEFDVKEGWEPLCKFLDVPVPKEAFPRSNEREKMQSMYLAMQLYGFCVWCFYLGTAAAAGYLAVRPDVGKILVSKAAERFRGFA